jgi:hypothetical protein
MGETRGYQTINDRTDGWGPGVDEELQPDSDAAQESRNSRIGRLKKVRKRAKAGTTPDNLDRTKGAGGEFDTTASADDGYRTDGPGDVWDNESLTLGTDFDLDAETGSNTAYAAGDARVDSTQRASKPLPTWNADHSVTPNASYTSDPVEQDAS